MRTAIVSTVKAPKDQILAFVHYHLNLGIDRIFLFLDDPRDLAYEAIFDPSRVSITRCDRSDSLEEDRHAMSIEERQERNANRALQIALNSGIEWITHIDCDELIYPTVDLKKHLCGLDYKVQSTKMVLHEAIAADPFADNIFTGVDHFKNLASPQDLEAIKNRGRRNLLTKGKYFRGHTMSKCWTRVSPGIVNLGIHYPTWDTPEDASQIDSNDLHLLHYDCTTFHAWKHKWTARIDGSGTATRMTNRRRRQLHLFKRYYYNNDDTGLLALFKRFHCIETDDMAFLSQMGLISRIFVDTTSFQAADDPGPVHDSKT